jgi:hypothetical protein
MHKIQGLPSLFSRIFGVAMAHILADVLPVFFILDHGPNASLCFGIAEGLQKI